MVRQWMAHLLRLVVAAAIAAASWASEATAQTVSAPSDTSTVHVGPASPTYSPDPVTIAVGDTVHWVWDSSFHSTTSGSCSGTTCTADGKFDSLEQNSGFTFDHTFTATGTYNYFCIVHGELFGMRGSIIVVQEVPIAGLSASSSSPTPLGSATFFTATVSSGSHITYTWDFGDGAMGAGITTTHIYAAFGNYTAVVTATNTISTMVATTNVSVWRNIFLPVIMR